MIVAHPELQASGTQQFLKEAAHSADGVTWHPLKWVNTNDNAIIGQERKMLQNYTRIILQFPLYWYQAPALLLQWLAVVLHTDDEQKMAEKELGIVVNIGQPLSDYRLGGSQGFSLSELLSPFAAIARRLKMKLLPLFVIEQFHYQQENQKKHLLVEYLQYLELEQPFTFAKKEEWFIKHLQQIINSESKNEVEESTWNAVLELFQERSEELAELKAEIKIMRRDDENQI